MKGRDWGRALAGLALLAPAPLVAHAETYLSEAQAGALLFPDAQPRLDWVELTPDQVKAIEKASKERVPDRKVRVWLGPSGEALFVDRVLGKHESIVYAVAVSSAGAIAGVEIMDYRETYGGEIRKPEWRRQFVGRRAQDPVRVDKDIKNIAGATISSVHVTNGVRRLLQTYAVLKAKA